MGQTHGLVASGQWTSLKKSKKNRIASWTDDNTGETLLFEFKKNGKMSLYHDKNDDGRLSRKKDQLIGDGRRSQYSKDDYSRDHFFKMRKGYFELEVEGWTDDDGKYDAWYYGRLDTGVDTEVKWGGRPTGEMKDLFQGITIMDSMYEYITSAFQPDV
jgi:hypothetical protein